MKNKRKGSREIEIEREREGQVRGQFLCYNAFLGGLVVVVVTSCTVVKLFRGGSLDFLFTLFWKRITFCGITPRFETETWATIKKGCEKYLKKKGKKPRGDALLQINTVALFFIFNLNTL